MGEPQITAIKKGKYIELISPTDGAILLIKEGGHVQCIGFQEQESDEPEEDEATDNVGDPGVSGENGTGLGEDERAGGSDDDDTVELPVPNGNWSFGDLFEEDE